MLPVVHTTFRHSTFRPSAMFPASILPACLRLLGLALLGSLLAACALKPLSPDWRANAFSLYYGQDPQTVDRTVRGSGRALVVLDTRRLDAGQTDAARQQARAGDSALIAYLSIGELDQREEAAFRRFAANQCRDVVADLAQIGFEWNDKFRSWRVDVSQPCWRRWVFAQADALLQHSDGLFLDTPDTIDRYITHPQWNRQQRGEKVRAMVALIRDLKARAPYAHVLLNRGLNLVGKGVWMDEHGQDLEPGLALMTPHPHNPDALLYENAFASTDPWTQRIEADIAASARAGQVQVYALGYADTLGDRQHFQARAQALGYVAAWAESSTSLHLQASETLH